jgi:hypothetical protein
MNKEITKEIVWSKGRTKKEMKKQTSWSSSKDWSGLSGLEIKAWDFTDYVTCKAITSHGMSHNKFFQIPVDKIEDFCNTLMQAKQLMESNNEKI